VLTDKGLVAKTNVYYASVEKRARLPKGFINFIVEKRVLYTYSVSNNKLGDSERACQNTATE
jgi:hypothetical protein